MKKLSFAIIILALLSLAAVPYKPFTQETCYPFQLGRVCMTDQITSTATPVNTDIPTATNTPLPIPTNTPTIAPTATPIPTKFSWQTNFEFYRNPQTALIGTTDSATWLWPGNALTASTITFYPTLISNVRIRYARWVVVWTPNTDAIPTGMRLVVTDAGPSNIVELAQITYSNYHNPMVSAVNVTTALQGVLDNSTGTKFLGQQTIGNGTAGAQIYASWIEIIWETK